MVDINKLMPGESWEEFGNRVYDYYQKRRPSAQDLMEDHSSFERKYPGGRVGTGFDDRSFAQKYPGGRVGTGDVAMGERRMIARDPYMGGPESSVTLPFPSERPSPRSMMGDVGPINAAGSGAIRSVPGGVGGRYAELDRRSMFVPGQRRFSASPASAMLADGTQDHGIGAGASPAPSASPAVLMGEGNSAAPSPAVLMGEGPQFSARDLMEPMYDERGIMSSVEESVPRLRMEGLYRNARPGSARAKAYEDWKLKRREAEWRERGDRFMDSRRKMQVVERMGNVLSQGARTALESAGARKAEAEAWEIRNPPAPFKPTLVDLGNGKLAMQASPESAVPWKEKEDAPKEGETGPKLSEDGKFFFSGGQWKPIREMDPLTARLIAKMDREDGAGGVVQGEGRVQPQAANEEGDVGWWGSLWRKKSPTTPTPKVIFGIAPVGR